MISRIYKKGYVDAKVDEAVKEKRFVLTIIFTIIDTYVI
jgi:hypothetical protein